MNQDATTALVPELRFPEFQNTGEWETTSIGDLKPFVTSGSRGWARFYAEEGELFVRITNLWRDSIYLDLMDSKFVQLPSEASEGVRTQLKEHDILISITADIGLIGYVDESVPSPAYINQHIALVRFDKKQLCGKYVAYFLASEKSQRLFRASTDIGTKAGMSLLGIQKIQLTFPGLPEQEHIAEFLTSVDKLIAAQAQKVETLKTHKKGLIQRLFPREGETQPRLRFPEFQDSGKWESKMLVEACGMRAGKFVSRAEIKELDGVGMFPCYGGNGLRGFTETYTHDGTYPLIGRQGALCGNVKFATGKFHATEHAVVATPKRSVEVVWLYYLLDLLNLNRFATGQAQPGLSVDVLEKVPVTIPGDNLEQQRIASCLSSLDALITAENQKLDALKSHKKGLMQQLFPSTGVDEI
jgi:type I restriction enzyme S subunit